MVYSKCTWNISKEYSEGKKKKNLLVIFNFFFSHCSMNFLSGFWNFVHAERNLKRVFFFFFNDKFMSLCRIRIDNERNQVCNCTYTVRLCDIIISQILHTHCTSWWNVKFLHIHDISVFQRILSSEEEMKKDRWWIFSLSVEMIRSVLYACSSGTFW